MLSESLMQARARIKNSRAPAAAIALSVLELLATNGNQNQTLSDIASALKIPKSTAHRVLGVMEAAGWVRRDPETKRFRLGAVVLGLSRAYLRELDFLKEFSAVARRIASTCNETVYAAMLEGTNVRYVARQDAPCQAVSMVAVVGDLWPAHLTALGKVLLAGMSDEAIDKAFAGKELRSGTAASIVTLRALKEALAKVRAQNCAFDQQEYWPDVRCVSAPVFDRHGAVVSAISIAAPSSRVSREGILDLAPLIQEGAREISRVMGCTDWGYR